MKQGFIKVAAVTPKIRVADTQYNTKQISGLMKESVAQGAKIIVFPSLSPPSFLIPRSIRS